MDLEGLDADAVHYSVEGVGGEPAGELVGEMFVLEIAIVALRLSTVR
jgi:hypothetical protein